MKWLVYGIVGIGAALATLGVAGFRISEAPAPVQRGDDPPVLLLSAARDFEMEDAMARARARVDEFLVVVRRRPEGVYTAVKVPLSESETTEHLWLVDPRYEAGRIAGKVANNPVELSGWAVGDAVSAAPNEISDWMIIEDGVLQGGFTLEVARARMNPEEREAFDLSLGLRPDR